MVSASQIREVVNSYLSHDNADRFVREFAVASYNVNKSGDAEAIGLAHAVEFNMADLRSGCIQKASFLNALRKLVDVSPASNVRVFAQISDPVNRRLSVEEGAFRGWLGTSDRSPSVGFGSILLLQS